MKKLYTVLLLLSALTTLSNAEDVYSLGVINSDEKINEKTQSYWSEQWWQWALSFDNKYNPISDKDGNLCSLGQKGDIWFLAGSYETTPVERSCTIPMGKTIFLPIINTKYHAARNGSPTCERMILSAEQRLKKISNLYFEINNISMQNPNSHKQISLECFDPFEKMLPTGTNKKSWGYPAATNGYWVAIKPLEAGSYKLRFGGELPFFSQDITYHLTINE